MIEEIISELENGKEIPKEDLKKIIILEPGKEQEFLFSRARHVKKGYYQNRIFIRGLIEFTNYCRNDCYYCGIRRSNKKASRYRLSMDEILECCQEGYKLGFRTFVLQGGEDGAFSVEKLGDIISNIRKCYPDCAITLSFGEWEKEAYKYWYDCGASRYLLRHETANEGHYKKLHPESMSLSNRKKCLYNLKGIGYQTGSGFMVGSPFQTVDMIIEDLRFLKELNPHMIGIGPYISHKDTPFKDKSNGSLDMTLNILAILRLMFPKALIPSTTSLGTIHPKGRQMGILAGGNVVMPNLSPLGVRKKYMLYDNKVSTGEESAQSLELLKESMKEIGYEVVVDRGDSLV